MIREKIKERLSELDMKASEFAELIGVNKSSMSLFLSGKKGFKMENIEKAFEILKLEPTEMISKQADRVLQKYSKGLGMSENNLIEAMCLMYLDRCKDVIHCSKCGMPLVFTPYIPMLGIGQKACECGNIEVFEDSL